SYPVRHRRSEILQDQHMRGLVGVEAEDLRTDIDHDRLKPDAFMLRIAGQQHEVTGKGARHGDARQEAVQKLLDIVEALRLERPDRAQQRRVSRQLRRTMAQRDKVRTGHADAVMLTEVDLLPLVLSPRLAE